MRFGLSEKTLDQIKSVLKKYPEITDVLIFGSRVKNTYQPGSDIDLCLFGKNLNLEFLNKVSIELDELSTPYTFDVTIYEKIENQDLKSHIDRLGKSLYAASSQRN